MCGDQFTKPIESRYGSFVSSPNSVPKIQSSGLNPRKTANSAHFVSPISTCSSYGFAIRSLCAWKLSERSPGPCKSGVTIWLKPFVAAKDEGVSRVALSTAILAVLATIASLLSGQHANEAMMSQIAASDQWNYYQSKSIKASVLDTKISLASAPNESERAKAERYEKEQEEIKSEAEHKQVEAKTDFHRHEVFARGVAMFQIAIAIAA